MISSSSYTFFFGGLCVCVCVFFFYSVHFSTVNSSTD